MIILEGIKGAIFDIDGTLLDSMSIWDDLCSSLLKSMGVSPTEDIDSLVSSMTMSECAGFVVDRYNLSIGADEFVAAAQKRINEFYSNEVMLKKGVRALIEEFASRNISMILATTGDKELATKALRRNGILDCFVDILACDDFGTNKSEPLIYNKALEMLQLDKSCVYVFEDSATALRTAKQAGFMTVGIRDESGRAYWSELEEFGNYIVDELSEIDY